jgi:hypothetical protein
MTTIVMATKMTVVVVVVVMIVVSFLPKFPTETNDVTMTSTV